MELIKTKGVEFVLEDLKEYWRFCLWITRRKLFDNFGVSHHRYLRHLEEVPESPRSLCEVLIRVVFLLVFLTPFCGRNRSRARARAQNRNDRVGWGSRRVALYDRQGRVNGQQVCGCRYNNGTGASIDEKYDE